MVDNESARFALIKASSGKTSMQAMATFFHELDAVYPAFCWIERVPSKSNPADLPSRGETASAVALLQGSLKTCAPFLWNRMRNRKVKRICRKRWIQRLPKPACNRSLKGGGVQIVAGNARTLSEP